MGRGLSELQKTILRLAHENRQRGAGARMVAEGYQVGTDVKYPEVLSAHFGWKPVHGWHGEQFSKKSIGEKPYRSARVSLSRALSRLERRGLIIHTRSLRAGSWSGADLTDAGVEEARRLSTH